MIIPAGSTHVRTTSPVAHTRALPQTTGAVVTGRHHAEHLGDNAVSVAAFVAVPQHLPSGRRYRGIPGHLARVAYARAVRGQQ